MADQGKWFKLWTSVVSDPSLNDLSLENFGRWCLFGVFLKTHGTEGKITLKPPGRTLTELFQVPTFDEAIQVLHMFPNCTVTRVTNTSVTYNIEWDNWQKYQGDNSLDRVRKWREKQRAIVTDKKRREEIRREQKTETVKQETPPPSPPLRSGSGHPPLESDTTGRNGAAPKRLRPSTTVEALVESLAALEAYRGLDVRAAILRCQVWCETKGKPLSKARVVNWLNRDAADRVTPAPARTEQAHPNYEAWEKLHGPIRH